MSKEEFGEYIKQIYQQGYDKGYDKGYTAGSCILTSTTSTHWGGNVSNAQISTSC